MRTWSLWFNTTDEWIIERTGIRERRIIGKDESVATMGAAAARNAIDAAGIDKNTIDLIICATTSAARALPSAACEIQRELEIPAIPAFDIAAACAGFCYGLSVADQYIKSGMAKRILVIGSDCLSQLISPEDRSMVILLVMPPVLCC
ncbi:3-oxoacyl-[acyl-carrier-protein] synthase 3 [Alishewanella longhuensis]